MKRVLLATTAVAAFVAFSGTARAQDPGMADFGATEGGGGAGSAFTVTTSGEISFFLKYATGDDANAKRLATGSAAAALAGALDAQTEAVAATSGVTAAGLAVDVATAEFAAAEAALSTGEDGLFALVSGELHINGAATTDNGTDISTHLELEFSGIGGDATRDNLVGSVNSPIPVGDIVRVDELSMKIGGGWGSIELGANDGAEDSLKTYGGTVGAGTGGVDGYAHAVTGSVGYVTIGGLAGSGDSSDALKLTYKSPNVSGFQAGVSLNYQTAGPNDPNGGTFGVGLGAKYAGSGGGINYAVSLVWGDRTIAVGGDGEIKDPAKKKAAEDGYGGLGFGVKVGGGGVTGVVGVTIDGLGFQLPEDATAAEKTAGAKGPDIYIAPGVAYAIPGGKANVSLTAALAMPYGISGAAATDALTSGTAPEATNFLGEYVIFLSADYAVLPGVTLAVDLGYGDKDLAGKMADPADSTKFVNTKSAGFTGLLRAKASF